MDVEWRRILVVEETEGDRMCYCLLFFFFLCFFLIHTMRLVFLLDYVELYLYISFGTRYRRAVSARKSTCDGVCFHFGMPCDQRKQCRATKDADASELGVCCLVMACKYINNLKGSVVAPP
jgi:hypothetical protein